MGMIENLETVQTAESVRTVKPHQETADSYAAVVAQLNDQWRVIECRDGIQWILQRRDGQRAGQPRWMGVRYFRTREALITASRALCGCCDPAARGVLAALPDVIGR